MLRLSLFLCMFMLAPVRADEPEPTIPGLELEHGFADSSGVKIHYAAAGKGPVIVLIHGFPDFWYTWRAQMPALVKAGYRVVAIDQRGYNASDKPERVEDYALPLLVEDVVAVLKHHEVKKGIIVGHDWGGLVAWTFAMTHPDMIDRLIILNLPHPRGIWRELANNPDQQKASAYARAFQKPDAAKLVTADGLAFWIKDPEARETYKRAFRKSSLEGMLNYYKANYPREPYAELPESSYPQVKCSVLQIHGLADTALLQGGLNDTWKWVDADLTLVTIPKVGHFVQQDAAELVTKTLVAWLNR